MKKLKLPTWIVFWFDKDDPANYAEGIPGYGTLSKLGKRRAVTEAVLGAFGPALEYYGLKFLRCLGATEGKVYKFLDEQAQMSIDFATKYRGNLPDVVYRHDLAVREHPWRFLLPTLIANLRCVIVDGQLSSERYFGRQCPKPMYLRGLGK